MPLLFCLGQHAALIAVAERLEVGERLFAFLDDLYVISIPQRSVEVHNLLREELWRHSKISLHQGKTCIWNRGGIVPTRCEELEETARIADPRTRGVWRGSHDARLEEQGITILGTPVGRPEFVVHALSRIAERQGELLQKIPEVKDLQCAWLILLYCGVTRATFYVRSVRPDLTENFAEQHDEQVCRCFCELVGVAPAAPAASVRASTSLPLAAGGLGLRSALRLRHAAHWASWADTIRMVQERHPEVADVIVRAVEAGRRPASEQSILAHNICGKRGLQHPVGKSWRVVLEMLHERRRKNRTNPGQGGRLQRLRPLRPLF